ncbi:MAG: alkaline phosphatase family protein [Methanothrix sp.]|uniref:alkaline phosphatase family protein n=1 Tax=Methanothrix sp. TaxID=90426 RepID=UPI0025F7E523|nr:alkaline phosphatase family protein [Methanothrix sp.]MCQ8903510.1 alkaline phosphatase family protein [Methanothrix sp.]
MLPLIIFLLISPAICASDGISPGGDPPPRGAVLLIVDGLGSSYIYPEHMPYSVEGRPLEQAVLFNISDGARVLDMRAPVPSTVPAHSTIVTGCSSADEILVGMDSATIFDAARNSGYICLAILQRGDFMNMLLEQDGVLYFENNSLSGDPTMGSRSDLPDDAREILEEWMHAYRFYSSSYPRYNRWGLDAAADIVRRLDRPFLLTVNIGGIDSAGHYRGFDEYIRAVRALDVGLGELVRACRERGVLLILTADHGMSFRGSRGGHAGENYSDRLESLRIPMIAIGPGVDEVILGGKWSQADIAPTLLALLGIDDGLTMSDGRSLPIRKRYNLRVELPRPGVVEVHRNGSVVARDTGSSSYTFRGLERGAYDLYIAGHPRSIVLSDDTTLDLRHPSSGVIPRWLVGALLIITINACGIFVIVRLLRIRGRDGQ